MRASALVKTRRWCVQVDGKVNEDAAWYYATPKAAAENIKVGRPVIITGQSTA